MNFFLGKSEGDTDKLQVATSPDHDSNEPTEGKIRRPDGHSLNIHSLPIVLLLFPLVWQGNHM